METGILRGDEETAPLAPRWDKLPGHTEDVDFGDIGEDVNGVWVTIHPATLLTEMPGLWAPFTRWRLGLRELGLADIQSLSAYDARAHITMMASLGRASNRRAAPQGGDE